ncbi:hypothetical protein [Oerskovia turbata]
MGTFDAAGSGVGVGVGVGFTGVGLGSGRCEGEAPAEGRSDVGPGSTGEPVHAATTANAVTTPAAPSAARRHRPTGRAAARTGTASPSDGGDVPSR